MVVPHSLGHEAIEDDLTFEMGLKKPDQLHGCSTQSRVQCPRYESHSLKQKTVVPANSHIKRATLGTTFHLIWAIVSCSNQLYMIKALN